MKQIRFVFIISMMVLISLFFINLFINPDGMQMNLFFGRTRDYMMDFYNNIYMVQSPNPYLSTHLLAHDHAYPPLAFLIFKFLYTLTVSNNFAESRSLFVGHYFICSISCLFFICLYSFCKLKPLEKNLIILCFMFSGLFLYSWERGNIILLSVLCAAFFLFNYKSENKFIREFSLFVLALACALKITPALLGILLLYKKRWHDALKVGVYSVLMLFIPFMFFEGGLNNIPIFFNNMALNKQEYMYLRIPSFDIIGDYTNLKLIVKLIYIKFSFIISIIALITNYAQKVKWKQIAQLLLIMYSIFSTSFPYCMVYLMVPLILFFNKEEKEKHDWLYLLLFIIILNPLQVGLSPNSTFNYDLIQIAELLLLIFLTFESAELFINNIKNKKAAGIRALDNNSKQ